MQTSVFSSSRTLILAFHVIKLHGIVIFKINNFDNSLSITKPYLSVKKTVFALRNLLISQCLFLVYNDVFKLYGNNRTDLKVGQAKGCIMHYKSFKKLINF